jgi:hypothetical protein
MPSTPATATSSVPTGRIEQITDRKTLLRLRFRLVFVLTRRVEEWRGWLGGALRVSGPFGCRCPSFSPCPVSTPRSSNRTGGSPASGSPTRLTTYAHRGARRTAPRSFASPYRSYNCWSVPCCVGDPLAACPRPYPGGTWGPRSFVVPQASAFPFQAEGRLPRLTFSGPARRSLRVRARRLAELPKAAL